MKFPKTFPFGQFTLTGDQAFFVSKLSMAFVNLKPIVPGHVLIIPQRPCKRFHELTPEEVGDLYLSAQTVGKVLESAYDAKALTISMQDGIDAGQSVYHVHVHILPRKPNDFERNDDIYEALDKNEARLQSDIKGVDAEDDRKPRTAKEMAEEAAWLRSLFQE